MPYSGGYYLHNRPLLSPGLNSHTAALERPFSDETLAAVNAVQNVPWRVNTAVLETMRTAWVMNWPIAGMPRPDKEPLPPRIAEDLWIVMSKEQRSAHKAEIAELHGRNARAESHRFSWLARMDIATDLENEPAIWFPHFVDFRGRIYPMAAELNPQGDDASKALLMFARGKPLGEDGMAWLCVRAANAWGRDLDKLPLGKRVEWVMGALNTWIPSVAASPLDDLGWIEAEEPWCFLATCFELVAAGEEGPEFVSHLPVPLDGSCNGLQHLAAMGRDRMGAEATNILPSAERRDIYTEVAQRVNEIVVADAGKGNPEAAMWLGRINRKVVKRAVMTTPYGVTNRGIRDQLIADRHTEDLAGDITARGRAADYLRDCIQNALSATIAGAKQIMSWLQAVSEALAEAELSFGWKTPTGNTIQQGYWDITGKRVPTLSGSFQLQIETPETGLRKQKQILAAAPNVIHSFDAAHLCRTVNACVEAGVVDFAMIHDSFGTHAADTPMLGYVLRQEFARIYRTNWLQEIEDYVRGYAGDVEIPSWTEYVTLGDLEVDQVIDAEFFFA